MGTNEYNPYVDITSISDSSPDSLDAYKLPSSTNTHTEEFPTSFGDYRTYPPVAFDASITTVEKTESPVPTYEVPKILTVRKYRLYKKG